MPIFFCLVYTHRNDEAAREGAIREEAAPEDESSVSSDDDDDDDSPFALRRRAFEQRQMEQRQMMSRRRLNNGAAIHVARDQPRPAPPVHGVVPTPPPPVPPPPAVAAANVPPVQERVPPPPVPPPPADLPSRVPRGLATPRPVPGGDQIRSFILQDDIRSPRHAAALVAILQLAAAHPDGIGGALGTRNLRQWIEENRLRMFAEGGPLHGFALVTTSTLQRHISTAISWAHQARQHDHAPGNGELMENVPQWLQLLFTVLEARTNMNAQNQRAINTRREQQGIVRGVVGQQAPLGAGGLDAESQGHALRDERARNNGEDGQNQNRVHNIGQVGVQHVGVEGEDDNVNFVDPSRGRGVNQQQRNGVRRMNVHNFSANGNDVTARFEHIQHGYSALGNLADALAGSVNREQQQQPPPRGVEEIARGYAEILALERNHPDMLFFQHARQALEAELARAAAAHGVGNDA